MLCFLFNFLSAAAFVLILLECITYHDEKSDFNEQIEGEICTFKSNFCKLTALTTASILIKRSLEKSMHKSLLLAQRLLW